MNALTKIRVVSAAAILCLLALCAPPARAGELLFLSSKTFTADNDSDKPTGIAIDNGGSIVVAGDKHNGSVYECVLLKYDAGLGSELDFATYHPGDAGAQEFTTAGVAVDTDGNIYVAGRLDDGLGGPGDFVTLKFDSSLAFLSSATYDGGNDDVPAGIAADASGNVFVTGMSNNGSDDDYCTVRYDSFLREDSEITIPFDGGGSNDSASGIVVDKDGNIVVAGYSDQAGTNDYYIVKYSSDLSQTLASRTFNAGNDDQATGVAVDPSGNIIVTGTTSDGMASDYVTVKIDPGLTQMISSATFVVQNPSSLNASVATDGLGNIILAGTRPDDLSNLVYLTVRYDPALVVMSSATYNSSGIAESAWGECVVADSSGNIVTAGYISTSGGSEFYFDTVKYLGPAAAGSVTPSSAGPGNSVNVTVGGKNFAEGCAVSFGTGITVVSSTVVSATQLSASLAVAEDAPAGSRSVTVMNTDGTPMSLPALFSVVYPAPSITSVSPSSGTTGATLNVTVNGANLHSGCSVSFGSGVTVNSVTRTSTAKLTANITIASNAALGSRTITVTNQGSVSGSASGLFTVAAPAAVDSGDDGDTATASVSTTTVVDTGTGATVTLNAESGGIILDIPAQTFGQTVTLSLSTAAPVSTGETLKASSIFISITNDLSLQPLQAITLTIRYRDADIAGLDETKLTVARYDEMNLRWVRLPSTVYPDDNRIEAQLTHLSRFAVMQKAPAATLAGVKAYPVPFNPKAGALTFDMTTADAQIKIYTIAGELVRELNETDGDGRTS